MVCETEGNSERCTLNMEVQCLADNGESVKFAV